MNRRFVFLVVVVAGVALFPFRSPAPLIYTPGEGWYYELPGTTAKWTRTRAKEQLDVAEQAFKAQNYSLALRAADRIVKVWPLSDYAPRAQYLAGRCLEAKGKDQMAFDAYQKIIEQYPKSAEYEDVLWRQYEIADRFLHGEWPRLWGYIPYPPSMDLPANMFGEIVTNGPYSDVAPHAQLRIGAAREGDQSDERGGHEACRQRRGSQKLATTLIAALGGDHWAFGPRLGANLLVHGVSHSRPRDRRRVS